MRGEFEVSKASGLNYLLYVPEPVQGDRDKKSPTILFLHGLGESGKDPVQTWLLRFLSRSG
jgi:predicted peptidase